MPPEPRGRNTHWDLGIWSDAQIPQLSRIAAFIAKTGSIPAAQIGHAGTKAARQRPFSISASWIQEAAFEGESSIAASRWLTAWSGELAWSWIVASASTSSGRSSRVLVPGWVICRSPAYR